MPDSNVSMLTHVTSRLDPEFFLPGRWVGYPAAYGTPMSYEDSVASGIDHVDEVVGEVLDAAPGNQIALLGYSQGAAIVRRYMDSAKFRDRVDEAQPGTFVGAGLVADPYRPRTAEYLVHVDPGGYGLAGLLPIWSGGYLLEVAAHRDPICSAPHDSYLRTVADFTGWMTTDPARLGRWAQAIQATLKSRGWQNANLDWTRFWETGQRVDNAVDLIGGYLPRIEYHAAPWLPPAVINPGGGRHTCYGTETAPGFSLTYCELLAAAMSQKAKEATEA